LDGRAEDLGQSVEVVAVLLRAGLGWAKSSRSIGLQRLAARMLFARTLSRDYILSRDQGCSTGLVCLTMGCLTIGWGGFGHGIRIGLLWG